MPALDLSRSKINVGTTMDNVTIIQCLECSPTGGSVLDVAEYPQPIIQAGHIIVRDTTGDKAYKPMPINSEGTAYEALPSNHKIVGVLYSSIPKREPSATIMIRGAVNRVSSPFPVTEEIEKALPLINFTQD